MITKQCKECSPQDGVAVQPHVAEKENSYTRQDVMHQHKKRRKNEIKN